MTNSKTTSAKIAALTALISVSVSSSPAFAEMVSISNEVASSYEISINDADEILAFQANVDEILSVDSFMEDLIQSDDPSDIRVFPSENVSINFPSDLPHDNDVSSDGWTPFITDDSVPLDENHSIENDLIEIPGFSDNAETVTDKTNIVTTVEDPTTETVEAILNYDPIDVSNPTDEADVIIEYTPADEDMIESSDIAEASPDVEDHSSSEQAPDEVVIELPVMPIAPVAPIEPVESESPVDEDPVTESADSNVEIPSEDETVDVEDSHEVRIEDAVEESNEQSGEENEISTVEESSIVEEIVEEAPTLEENSRDLDVSQIKNVAQSMRSEIPNLSSVKSYSGEFLSMHPSFMMPQNQRFVSHFVMRVNDFRSRLGLSPWVHDSATMDVMSQSLMSHLSASHQIGDHTESVGKTSISSTVGPVAEILMPAQKLFTLRGATPEAIADHVFRLTLEESNYLNDGTGRDGHLQHILDSRPNVKVMGGIHLQDITHEKGSGLLSSVEMTVYNLTAIVLQYN